jgi:nucleoside-diphosphate-sugar epimerase
MGTVFVTGGSGFIGGALLDAFRERGEHVTALARTPTAEAVVASRGGMAVPGDLTDAAALRAGMAGAELVVHCAAKLVGGPREAADFHRVNVEGTRAVLAAARATGVPRLIYLSTEQVLLGERPLVDADEAWPYPERPAGPYAATKGEAERLLLESSTRSLATISIRPRLVWGHGDRTVLPALVRAARTGRLRWIDGGGYLTSTTHVRNVVEGVLAAAERGRGGEAYFVTDGPPVPFRGFVSALLATQGVPAPTGTAPRWLARALAALAGAAWRLLPLSGMPPLDPIALRVAGEVCTVRDDKARRELGYEGKVSRERGFAELQAGNTSDGGVPAPRVAPGSSTRVAAGQAADADRRDADAGGNPTR